MRRAQPTGKNNAIDPCQRLLHGIVDFSFFIAHRDVAAHGNPQHLQPPGDDAGIGVRHQAGDDLVADDQDFDFIRIRLHNGSFQPWIQDGEGRFFIDACSPLL